MGDALEQTTEPNVDQIMDSAYEPEAPLSAPNENDIAADSSQDSQSEPQVEQVGDKFVLNYKGKEIELDPDKARNYAQKGYDYEKKMRDFKVQKKLYEQELEQEKSKYGELAEINEFAKQNPAFEQLIQREWAKIQSGQQLEVAPEDKVTLLESRLNQVLDKLESQEKQLTMRQQAEMEAAQETAIESYKGKYSDFDWDSKDENGATLEDRIMQQMIDKGVKDFEIMADHVLKTELLAKQQMEAKRQIGKQIQHSNKHGLGRVTSKSQQQKTETAKNIRSKSYDDLVAEGLAELGIEY
jgi:hypothetical protein